MDKPQLTISGKAKIVSLILKAITVFSAVAGVLISAYASKDTFMGGGRVFMYFTIQSNVAIALIACVGAVFLLSKKQTGELWSIILFVGTVSITLTGAVFTFVLAPTLGPFAWVIQNVLTHVIVPVAAIADFFVVGPYGVIRRRHVFYVVLPPLAYAIYAGIGYLAGWEFSEGTRYPYFFLNWGSPAGAFGFTNELPFMGVVWWILALLVLLLVVGYLYLAIAKKIQNKKRRST